LILKAVLQVSEVFLIYITVILIICSLFTVTNAILMKWLLSTVIHNLLQSFTGLTSKKSNLFFHS